MNIIKKIIIGIGVFFILLVIWGLIEPYTIDVVEEQAVIPNLPEEWVGEKIAVIADFQIGMWMDNDLVIPRVIDKIIEIEPKVVLILGDYVYHPNNDHKIQMETVVEYLRPLVEDDLKIYSVLGNHDYSLAKKDDPINRDTAERVSSMLGGIGIKVLNNESVALSLVDGNVRDDTNSNNPLYIAGLGSYWANEGDVEKTFNSFPEDAPRFVMLHNPRTFTLLDPDTAPVTVAGHTHGGQIRLPFSSEYSYLNLLSEEKSRVDGWIKKKDEEDFNRLYVNRGIGLSLIPIRINCPPEITIFTLQGP
ncbi:MAG: metallophosphoesterase [Bacillota bacterium]